MSYTDLERQLHDACQNGNTQTVEDLLSRGVSPLIEFKKYNAIQRAAAFGHIGVLQKLLAKNQAWASVPSSQGWTPLHSAASYGREEAVRFLILNGARNKERSNAFADSTPAGSARQAKKESLSRFPTRDVSHFDRIITMLENPKSVTAEAVQKTKAIREETLSSQSKTALHAVTGKKTFSEQVVALGKELGAFKPSLSIFEILKGSSKVSPLLARYSTEVKDAVIFSLMKDLESKGALDTLITPEIVESEGASPLDYSTADGNTLFHYICREGFAKTAELLLSHHADTEALDSKMMTPFETAIHYDENNRNYPLILNLLNHSPSIIHFQNPKTGATPLHWAAKKHHAELLNELLMRGADPTIVATHAQMSGTPKDIIAKSIEYLKKTGLDPVPSLEAMLKTLIQAETSLDSHKLITYQKLASTDPRLLEIFFLESAKRRELDEMQKIYSVYPEVINAKPSGYSPLHYATYYGYQDILEWLAIAYAEAGIPFPINDPDGQGQNALYFAIIRKYQDLNIIRWLLAQNADPIQLNSAGLSALHKAAGMGDLRIIREILTSPQAKDPDKKALWVNFSNPAGVSILHSACRHGQLDAALILISHGANPNTTMSYGETILDSAIQGAESAAHLKNYLPLIQELVSRKIPYSRVSKIPEISKILPKRKPIKKAPDSIPPAPAKPEAPSLDSSGSVSTKSLLSPELQAQLLDLHWVNTGDPSLLILNAYGKKPGGSNPGALYKSPDGRKWVGKMGYESLPPSEVTKHLSTRSRTERGMAVDAIREEISLSMYRLISDNQYQIPDTKLASLPVYDPEILKVPSYQSKILSAFPSKTDTREVKTTFVMSELQENIRLLINARCASSHEPLIQFISEKHALPEIIYFSPEEDSEEPPASPELLSTLPLISLLAHAKVLGDVDVFSPALSNVGYDLTHKKWIKFDGTHAFQGLSYTDMIHSPEYQLLQGGNARDVQLSARESGTSPLMLKWSLLTIKQKQVYLDSLRAALALFSEPEVIELCFERHHAFEIYGGTPDQIQLGYQSSWQNSWLLMVKQDYEKELSPGYLLSEPLSQEASAAPLSSTASSSLETTSSAATASEAGPAGAGGPGSIAFYSPPMIDPKTAATRVSTLAPIILEGISTRLMQSFSTELKRIWTTKKYWPDASELFQKMLEFTEGNGSLALGIIGRLTGAYGLELRQLLRSKGVAESDLCKINQFGQEDGSLSTILQQNQHLLSKQNYDEYPLSQVMLRLQNFMRHSTEVDALVESFGSERPEGTARPIQTSSTVEVIQKLQDENQALRDQVRQLNQTMILLTSTISDMQKTMETFMKSSTPSIATVIFTPPPPPTSEATRQPSEPKMAVLEQE